ncbi:MAG: SGNH/GDSL hydrolase family protein, partial [Roseomonas mucosa]|nr:SGNH/GDSL hydrolase family protein [Roseomonas mucosa]
VATNVTGTQVMNWISYLLRRRIQYDPQTDRYGGNAFKISNLITVSTGAPQAQLTAALAVGADIVILDACTFDVQLGEAPATTFANMQTLINYFLAAGTQVVVMGPRPVTTWNADTTLNTQYRRRAQHLGTLLSRYARATPGVAYADAWRALTDPTTGEAKTGYLGVDGLSNTYPGVVACAMAAKRAAAIIAPMLPANGEPRLAWGAADIWHADDPLGNLLGSMGVFAGTGGTKGAGVTGEVADGWSAASSVAAGNISGTAVASREATAAVPMLPATSFRHRPRSA